jgi:hypothetical protein
MNDYCHSCGHYSEVYGHMCTRCISSYYDQIQQYNDLPEKWQESDANPEG